MSPYPYGCMEPESEVECIRDTYPNMFYWLALQSVILLSIIYVSVLMFVVYRYVRDTERMAAQYSFVARFRAQNEKKTMKRSRRVMIQGILYCVAMVLLYIFTYIQIVVLMITKKRIPMLDLIILTLSPLQGVFNVCIYLIPFFRKKLKICRQSEDSTKEQTKVNRSTRYIKPSTEAYYKRTRSSVIAKVEQKREIPVVQQHTFYPESNMVEGNGEGCNVHDDHAAIDDDENENDSDSSGDDYY